MSNDVTVQCRDFGGCTILTVPGDVDASRVNEIHGAAAAADSQHVVLDLGKASAVHPSAVSALVDLHHRIQARGGGVCIVTREIGVRSQVQEAASGSTPRFYDEIGDALEASMAARQASLSSRWADAVS
ncbi:STAS domain-containing protein [Jiangella asiatica]|uniref:STAS domain-containing protein n=1 Tax=Jiangella asiatica TaxID=2530372 RepID=UPI0013A5D964|nr:STAS domain-containing protein [Jiangella asiatica]